jgi:UDP-N-acetylmuramyl pentapeptide phosphotransferase/UDP-N-acetylglucosamine-1-phosphate transferase
MLIATSITFLVCLLILITAGWHGNLTLDNHPGIQRFHATPTPRIGGLGIMLGLWAASSQAPELLHALLHPMLLACLPTFLAGTLEDLTKKVSVRDRLLATFASGLTGQWLTATSLTHLNLWGFDTLLAWTPFAWAFTSFAIGGMTNALNIIDGLNGLAAGVATLSWLTFSLIAWQLGDRPLTELCLLLSVAPLGFLLFNFPWGKIFLGDGGAYSLGFMLAWTAVLLAERHPNISPWTGLLICAYPVIEVLFSMRRRQKRKTHIGHPDCLHLHSLVKVRLVRKHFPNHTLLYQNSATSPLLCLFALIPAPFTLLFYHSTPTLIATFLAYALLYTLLYARLASFHWRWPKW